MSKFVAGGDIHPSRFVSRFVLDTHTLLQCNDNMPTVGVSYEKAKSDPLNRIEDEILAAKSGEEIEFYGGGMAGVLLELGGPVRFFDRLKSDHKGRGVVTKKDFTTAQHCGATALENGFAGDKIRVFVTLGAYMTKDTLLNINISYTYEKIEGQQ